MTLWQRLRSILGAGLLGWLASYAVTLWFVIPIAQENSFGDQHIYRHELYSGFAIWALWTLWLSLFPTVFIATPLALLLSPRWLYRFRWQLLLCVFGAAVAIPAYKFGVHHRIMHTGDWDPANFWPYVLFTTFYSIVLLGVYLRSVGKALHRGPGMESKVRKGCNPRWLRR